MEYFSELTISQLIGDGMLLTLIITTFIEITPIKWNPLTSILSWLGKRINKPVIDKVESIQQKTEELEKKIDMNEIDHIRWEILNFANSCRHGQHHTRDEFVHVIDLHEKYVKLLEAHNMTNGLITVEYEYIEEIYRQCLEKNSFI